MKKYVDLHIHSNCCDGSFSPEEIVERAVRYNLSVISITDHDTVSCIEYASKLADSSDLIFIPGMEVSTKCCNGSMHILAYYIDIYSQTIHDLSKKMIVSRRKRIIDVCQRLSELSKPVNPEFVFELSKKANSYGRPHIAKAMVKLGYVPSVHAAFTRYLGYGKPAYVPRWSPEPKEAIDVIHSAGGLAVIAHCGVTKGCFDLLDSLVQWGIDGIEVYYPGHHPKVIEKLLHYAQSNSLAITGGSDCHGFVRGEPLLGIYKVPFVIYENLKAHYDQNISN